MINMTHLTHITKSAGRLKFLLLYLLGWVAFFQFARIVFYVSQWSDTLQLNFRTILFSFLYGIRMDLSMAAYLTVPVCILVLLSIFIPFFRRSLPYKIYSGILVFIILLIVVADIEVFKQWGFRIDASPLKYLESPNEVWASISHLPIVFYILLFLLIFLLTFFFFAKFLNRISIHLMRPRYPFFAALIPLVFAGLMIIPIRGGFQLTPMNQSIVYFSPNNFANQAAVNATWNLMYTLVSENDARKNPYNYMPAEEAAHIKDSLFKSSGETSMLLNTRSPNIILIIWESFTKKATEAVIEGQPVTPWFNEWKKQGVYFSNAYASGDRTDKGIAAVLAAYPALPKTSVIRLPSKVRKLETLSGVYKKLGYHTPFYYGGETEFANIKSFLLHSGFDPIVEKSSFASKDLNSKWGAHDGVVSKRILGDLNKTSEPFFLTWLTLSSHEPFETPVAEVFKGEDHTTKFLNSLHYTDAVINDFLSGCSRLPSWKNTLVIIVADHGHPLPETGNKIDNFKIPVLFLGGAVQQKGLVIDRVCSQLDIAATLMGQTSAKGVFPFSKNIMDNSSSPWAFFNFNDGFGFLLPEYEVLFDNIGKKVIYQGGKADDGRLQAGKALQQHIYQDYVDK